MLAFAAALLWLLAGIFIAGDTRLLLDERARGLHESPLDWVSVQVLLIAGVFVAFQAVRATCGRAVRCLSVALER
jgi:hypothetical protein